METNATPTRTKPPIILAVLFGLSLLGNGYQSVNNSALSERLDSFKNATKEVKTAADKGYWLSKSNKRHNYKCRYFENCAGRKCGKEDGVACGLCGG